MSNEIQNASLADRARALAVEMVGGAAEVNLALAAADSVKGIVITDEATSRQVADAAKVLVQGKKAIAAAKKRVLGPVKAAEEAVKEYLGPMEARIARGIDAADAAQRSWLMAERSRLEREKREAEEKERMRVAALERDRIAAAEEARRQMEQVGAPAEAVEQAVQSALAEEVAPPMDMPKVEAAKMVKGGIGSQVLVDRLAAEIANLADIDPALVDLRQKDAVDAVRRLIEVGDVEKPGIGREHGIVYRGVRYFYETGIAKR